MAAEEEPSTSRARHSSDFEDSSDRSKRRKTESLRSSYTTSELVYATQMSLRASGAPAASTILKEVTSTSPQRAQKYQTAYKESQKKSITEVSADIALNLIISGNMSKSTYLMTRSVTNENCKTSVYPAYGKILAAKKRCYPPISEMTFTETVAKVSLQSLLDHTVSRLFESLREVFESLDELLTREITLFLKWGCDGTSGQEYKQKFEDDSSSDAHVFFTSIVPLRLYAQKDDNEIVIIWNNMKPSSPRFCRPLKVAFLKETVQSTLIEKEDVEKQIENLEPFHTVLSSNNVKVNYQLAFTMIDGKVKNAITGTSSAMRCYICKATSKEFNDLKSIVEKEVDKENLRFGIGSLHAWIRFMEWFIHISYKNIESNVEKKWQARSAEMKEKVAARKLQIQDEFKKELGLRIDIPKGGAGTTNDGNTARRFFKDVSVSARILKIDEELMEDCKVILQTMSCGFDVNVDKFRIFCLNVAERYVKLYAWYPMPTSIHIVLIHGYAVIETLALPIGQLSEDAQEARNKDLKRFRENHARKCSRKETMEDVFTRLLVSSDPLISSHQKFRPKTSEPLSTKVLDLLTTSHACSLNVNDIDSEASDNE